MLARFATDAYDSMLMPSKEEGYQTPEFWTLLFTTILPAIKPEQGAELIKAGPEDERAAKYVERLASRLIRLKKATTWMQINLPIAYGIISHGLKQISRIRK